MNRCGIDNESKQPAKSSSWISHEVQQNSWRNVIANVNSEEKDDNMNINITHGPQVDCYSLYVKYLKPDINEKKLYEMFSKFGAITGVKICDCNLFVHGKFAKYGFVDFKNKSDAENAIYGMNKQWQGQNWPCLHVSVSKNSFKQINES